ncbi:hypothetical protein L6452_28616 [Arctium lappa]|uniref:Uncharacterized protein n=1 Tax=Arctium lappa TaxID=4217 RepID=A0ACB8ZZ67_ARCLA|nr:hypothetical protein L6452_28616 [Arctium lappa]
MHVRPSSSIHPFPTQSSDLINRNQQPSTHTQHKLHFFFSLNGSVVLQMAGVLETLTVPRASGLPSASLCPIVSSSPVSRLSGHRNFVNLPESRGLKIESFRSSGSVSLRSKSGRRGALIVCQAQEAVQVLPVTDATWESLVLESSLPVMVEFWAPWCGPCRMIHPVIDELAKEYSGKLTCYKVNTDESPAIASRYGIRSIPTVIIFKDGEKKDAVIGAVPRSTLCTSIEKFL